MDIVYRLRNGPAPLGDPNLNDNAADEIERLRGELAQAVGEMADQGPYIDKLRARNVELRTAQSAEPVAWMGCDGATMHSEYYKAWAKVHPDRAKGWRPLYAAPPAPAAVPPKPLTYAEIMSIAYDCNALPEVITDASMRVFVRAIERAHGIGDKP